MTHKDSEMNPNEVYIRTIDDYLVAHEITRSEAMDILANAASRVGIDLVPGPEVERMMESSEKVGFERAKKIYEKKLNDVVNELKEHARFCEDEPIRILNEKHSLDSIMSNLGLKQVPVQWHLGLAFDPETMEVIDTEPAQCVNLVGTVASVHDGGYWVMGHEKDVVSPLPITIYGRMPDERCE